MRKKPTTGLLNILLNWYRSTGYKSVMFPQGKNKTSYREQSIYDAAEDIC